MHLERYGLTSSPFGNRGDEAYVAVPSRASVVEQLEQSLLGGHGIAVLTSTAGLGKSTLCRELQRRLQPDWLVSLLQDCGCTTRRSLLQAILYELGLPYAGLSEQESRLRMFDAIRDRRPAKQGLILIVDEAQRLNDRLLDELRSLANHTVDGEPLIRLLLCGDLVLEERLISPALAGIHQRVVGHESLLPLSYEESARLIDAQLIRAGGDGWEHVYTKPAMELLCLVSDGSPRNLEQLASRSLQIADRNREPRVSVDAVRAGLSELKELPLQWNEPANLDAYSEPNGAEVEPMDIVDLRSELADGDTICVQVGDELPVAATMPLQPAAFIEFGGDALTPTTDDESSGGDLDELFTRSGYQPHALLDDAVEPGLAETAVIEFGRPTAVSSALPLAEARPAWEVETVVLRGTPSPVPAQQPSSPPDWIELDIDDRYAALDAETPLPPPRKAVEVERVPCTPAIASAPIQDCLDSASVELQILHEVHEIKHEVEHALTGRPQALTQPAADAPPPPAAAPAPGGLGSLPEWDVVQPEWVTRDDFTPVPIEAGRSVVIDVDAPAAASMLEPEVIFTPEPVAADELVVITESRPQPIVADTSAAGSDEDAEPFATERPAACEPIRIDTGSQRPYAQLFSRLVRLRHSFLSR